MIRERREIKNLLLWNGTSFLNGTLINKINPKLGYFSKFLGNKTLYHSNK